MTRIRTLAIIALVVFGLHGEVMAQADQAQASGALTAAQATSNSTYIDSQNASLAETTAATDLAAAVAYYNTTYKPLYGSNAFIEGLLNGAANEIATGNVYYNSGVTRYNLASGELNSANLFYQAEAWQSTFDTANEATSDFNFADGQFQTAYLYYADADMAVQQAFQMMLLP